MATNYPVITWVVYESTDTPGDITVTANNVTDQISVTTNSADVWGFGTDGSGNPSADSLAKRLEVALATHTDINSAGASYDWTGTAGTDANGNAYTGFPATKFDITKTGNSPGNDNVDWSDGSTTVTETNFGQTSSDTTVIDDATTTSFYLRWNVAGFWAPGLDGTLNVQDDRIERNVAFASFSPHEVTASNFSHTYWGQHTVRTLTYDIVDDAFLRAYRAADTTFAGRAQREATASTYDPNNLLETLVQKGAEGALFRIYTADNTYRTAKMVDGFSIGDLITPVSNSGARFRVTIPFIDIG